MKYDFKYLDDSQLIMMALTDILWFIARQKNMGNYKLIDELEKRFSEQRQHIPLQDRCEHEFVNPYENITDYKVCSKCGNFLKKEIKCSNKDLKAK